MFDAGSMSASLALTIARLSGAGNALERKFGGLGAILHITHPPLRPAEGAQALDALLRSLAGFDLVSLGEASERISTGGGRFVALTAGLGAAMPDWLPVLNRYRAPFTLFVAPGLVSGQAEDWPAAIGAIVRARPHLRMETMRGAVMLDCSSRRAQRRAFREICTWLANETPELAVSEAVRRMARESGVDLDAFRRARIMNWEQIRAIAADPLVSIGASGMRNLRLARLPEESAKAEIEDSRTVLRMETGINPLSFAFPHGDIISAGPREARMARDAGFQLALTAREGMLLPAHAAHRHALPRLTVVLGDTALLRTRLTGLGAALANRGRPFVAI